QEDLRPTEDKGIVRAQGRLQGLTLRVREGTHEERLCCAHTLQYGALPTKLSETALAYLQGDYTRAAVQLEESLALKRELGDTQGIARSLSNLGMVAYLQGDLTRAVALYEESL